MHLHNLDLSYHLRYLQSSDLCVSIKLQVPCSCSEGNHHVNGGIFDDVIDIIDEFFLRYDGLISCFLLTQSTDRLA